MAAAPYHAMFRRGDELCFYAPVPALAHIGRCFDELSEASVSYKAPEEEQSQWRRLAGRLEELLQQAQTGVLPPWPAVGDRLRREFQEAFTRACEGVSRYVQEYFDTGQMPLAEYLEWVLLSAERLWFLHGGDGFDMDRFQARTDRLSRQLQASNYEIEVDRRIRQEDPERYEYLTRSLERLNDSMRDPDPEAHQRMIVEQMEAFRQSPMFARAQEATNQMRAELESLRETDPDLYEQQRKVIEETERFCADPAAAMREMAAAQSEAADRDTRDAGEDSQPDAPPGQLLFNCGKREAITSDQIMLFEQFLQRQEALRPAIENALREMHRWMHPGTPFSWPGDRVLFPENPDESEVPLHCFRVREVSLPPKADGSVVMTLDSQFGHFDEHGCHMLVRNGALARFGTWDEVFADDDVDSPGDED